VPALALALAADTGPPFSPTLDPRGDADGHTRAARPPPTDGGGGLRDGLAEGLIFCRPVIAELHII